MKKVIFALSYSLYLFFILGFFLHTSGSPQILNKYSTKYAIFLLLLIASFPLSLLPLSFLGKKTVFKSKNKKITIYPLEKIILTILCLLLILVVPLEFWLRYKYRNYESNTYQYTLNNFDPFLQFRPTESYTSNINSYGFRGEEITKKKPNGTYRIFILCGSTVLNKVTPFEQSAPRILETNLRKTYPDQKIEVLNAGVDGYTSEHSLIQFLFKIKDFDPDLIIMWHGINDWYYSCSPSERARGTFQSDYSHFLSADAAMAYDHFKPQPLISFKLISYDFYFKLIKNYWFTDIYDRQLQKFLQEGAYYSDAYTHKQYDLQSTPSLESYKRNIKYFIDDAAASKIDLIIGNQPFLYKQNLTKEELSRIQFPIIQCTRNGKYPSIRSVLKTMNEFNENTKDIAALKNTHFIDLESKIPKNLKYFTDDVHYTILGNRKIADSLLQYIKENQIIEKRNLQ